MNIGNIVKECVICKKVFKTNRNKIQCCSAMCAHKLVSLNKQAKFIYKICPICGKKFHIFPSHIKMNIHCCSNACSFIERKGRLLPHNPEWCKHISESKKGVKIPSKVVPPILKPCEFCGKVIDIKRSSGGSSRGKAVKRFCNLQCWYSFIRLRPENHPTYSGGYDDPYYGSNWNYQRKLALKRDGYKCRSCGVSLKATRLDVHHIKPFKSFERWEDANILSNLITVCISCHQKAAYNKVSFPLPLL